MLNSVKFDTDLRKNGIESCKLSIKPSEPKVLFYQKSYHFENGVPIPKDEIEKTFIQIQVNIYCFITNALNIIVCRILVSAKYHYQKQIFYFSSKPWLSFFEKTRTIDVEKSTINAVIISDISITFHEY